MSLVCGIFMLSPEAKFPHDWARHLYVNIKRGKAGDVWQYHDDRLYLLQLDIGAFDAPGWSISNRHVIAIAGNPILTRGNNRTRKDDIPMIEHSDQLRLTMQHSRGYFNLVRYDLQNKILKLATDRVGLRSLYVYRGPDYIVFSGALRLIEGLPGIKLTTNLQGVLESACFGSALNNGTWYDEVQCLNGGTILTADTKVREERYWKWDRDAFDITWTDERGETPRIDDALDMLYETFKESVRLRVGGKKAVFSALSGGLDSRCVTAELWRQGLNVHALNVSWKGSMDDVLGAEIAGKLGIAYHHFARAPDDAGSTLTKHLYELLIRNTGTSPDANPHQIWSGNGGSLGLGHVKMTSEANKMLRAGDVAGAAKFFRNKYGYNLSGKLLRKDLSAWAESLPVDGMMQELANIKPSAPDRALYVFQLENGQRRMLAFHWEQIDLVPVEFIEPIFDPEVISLVCKLPHDFCLHHHMYHRWLERFPKEVTSVAWQTYPEHEPCPIPMKGFNQFTYAMPRAGRFGKAIRDLKGYFGKDYRGLLRTERVVAAYLARGLGLWNTQHLIKQVELLGTALERSRRSPEQNLSAAPVSEAVQFPSAGS